MVFRQIRLEVDLAASIREDELVLLVQRDSGASDVNGKLVGRNDDIDEALVSTLAIRRRQLSKPLTAALSHFKFA